MAKVSKLPALTLICGALLMAPVLVACEEEKGPAEALGEKVDEAVEKAGKKAEEAMQQLEKKSE